VRQLSFAVEESVLAYGTALRASVAAFRRYSDACVASDPGASALLAERDRLACVADQAHAALAELLREDA